MSTRTLLPLFIFIGFHQSSSLPQRELHPSYGNEAYAPQRMYAYGRHHEVPSSRLNRNVSPLSGNDDNDSRKFFLFSHDKTPNSETFKASKLAHLGLGPELYLKKEKEEKEFDPSRPDDPTSKKEKLKAGVQMLGIPMGPQLYSIKETDHSKPGSPKFDTGIELFGVPLTQMIMNEKKMKNEVDSAGDPLSQDSFVNEEEGAEDDLDGLGLGPQYPEEPEYDSLLDDVDVTPGLVPIGSVDDYGGSYDEEVFRRAPKQLKQHIVFTKEKGVQNYSKKQDSRRLFFGGNGDVRERASTGMNVFGLPVEATVQYDSRNGLGSLFGLGSQPSYYTKYREEPEYDFPRDEIAMKPQLVPIDAIDDDEESYNEEVFRTPSKPLRQQIVFTKQREYKISPKQYQTYPNKFQTYPRKQDSRRFFMPGNDDTKEEGKSGFYFLGVPVGDLFQSDKENEFDAIIKAPVAMIHAVFSGGQRS